MLYECLNAAEELAREDIHAEVIDLRSLQPLDQQTILESVRKTSKVCIVHEDTRTMGLGAELAALISEQALMDLDAPIVRVTGPDVAGIPFNDAGEAEFLPNAVKITEAARRLVRY
jgi:2-oxoisovalerate dehydrogenase E1 component beta subunit